MCRVGGLYIFTPPTHPTLPLVPYPTLLYSILPNLTTSYRIPPYPTLPYSTYLPYPFAPTLSNHTLPYPTFLYPI